jgi:hypothetical protein
MTGVHAERSGRVESRRVAVSTDGRDSTPSTFERLGSCARSTGSCRAGMFGARGIGSSWRRVRNWCACVNITKVTGFVAPKQWWKL